MIYMDDDLEMEDELLRSSILAIIKQTMIDTARVFFVYIHIHIKTQLEYTRY